MEVAGLEILVMRDTDLNDICNVSLKVCTSDYISSVAAAAPRLHNCLLEDTCGLLSSLIFSGCL